MADERIEFKIGGDPAGAIRALAAVAGEQAKLAGRQIALQKAMGAGDAEIVALQRQQNLQLERAWKLREKAAAVSAEHTGDSTIKVRESLLVEQERLAIKTGQIAAERAAAVEAAKVAEATRRAAEEAERAAQAARVRAAQDRASTADSRVGLAASRVELAKAQGAAEERVTQLLAAQRGEQERAWRLQMQAARAEGDQATIAQTRIRIQVQMNALAAEEARRRAETARAQAEAAKAGTFGGQLGALGGLRAQLAGSPAELAGGLKEAEAAATRLGGRLAGVNERLLGMKAAREQVRGLYSEVDRLAGMSLKAGLAIGGLGLAFGGAMVKSSLGLSAEREAVVNGLKAIMGSASLAEAHLKKLKEVAGLPGVNLDGAIRMSVGLQGAELSAAEATRAIKVLGNEVALMGGSDEQFMGAQRALVQIAGAAKLTAEDLNQLRDAGLPVGQILKQAFGTVQIDQIQALGLTGREALDKLVGAMEQAPTAAGGLKNVLENLQIGWQELQTRFGDGLKSGKLEAQGEKLTANLEQLEKVAEEAGKALVPLIEKAVEFATELTANDGAMLKSIATTTAWAGGLLVLGGGLGKLAIFAGEVKGALAVLRGAEVAAAAEAGGLRSALGGVTSAAKSAGPALAALAANPWTWVTAAAVGLPLLSLKLSGLRPAAKQAQESLEGYNQAVKEAAEQGFETKSGPAKLGFWDHLMGAIGRTTDNQRAFNEAMADGIRISKQQPEAPTGGAGAGASPAKKEDLGGLAGVEERRLGLARERLGLAQAEGVAFERQRAIWAEIDQQQAKVWAARLKAAQAEDKGPKLEQEKLAIEGERLRQATERIERETAHAKAMEAEAKKRQDEAEQEARKAQDRQKEALAGAAAVADLRLKAAAGEVAHAERMGASAKTLAALKAQEQAAQERAWQAQLAVAAQQVRSGEDVLALEKAGLAIANEKRAAAQQEAEARRREQLASLSAEQRLAQMAADRAEKQAERAGKNGSPGAQAEWQRQQEAWQRQADQLALKSAAANDPRGVNKAVQLELAQQAARELDKQIKVEDEARRQQEQRRRAADKEATRAARRDERLEALQLKQSGSTGSRRGAGAGTEEQLKAAVIGGDLGRVQDILQAGRGAALKASPTDILPAPAARMVEAQLAGAKLEPVAAPAAATPKAEAAEAVAAPDAAKERQSAIRRMERELEALRRVKEQGFSDYGEEMEWDKQYRTLSNRLHDTRRGKVGASGEEQTLDQMRQPRVEGFREAVADALSERDQRQQQALIDAIRGRGR